MAGKIGPKTENSAEKAYAAAAEAVSEKLADQPAVEFPSKAKRGRKPRVMAAPELPEDEVANSAAAKPATAVVALSAPATIEPPVVETARPPARKAMAARKPIKAKPIKATPAAPAKALTARIRPATVKPTEKLNTIKKIPTISQLKDKIMATQSDFTQASAYTPGADFTSNFKNVFGDVQEKAKAAFEKGTSAFGDYSAFTKGNVEAAVESGKILAAGLQELGTSYVSDSKSLFETMTADIKELAAAKTPVDFFKLHSELARRNFDTAVAFSSKSSEAVLKLAGDTFAPLSGRVNLAVEKIKQAA